MNPAYQDRDFVFSRLFTSKRKNHFDSEKCDIAPENPHSWKK
jgi:hypothetical protein